MTSRQANLLGATLIVGLASGIVARASSTPGQSAQPNASRVERGAYLVRMMGCNDCHTPWKMGENGPEPDYSRALTGHPQDVKIPAWPRLPDSPWAWMGSQTNTAFAGPWGVSFTANLTPDAETGLGKWTEDMFIATMRTGRHQGKGRPVLPPMPVQMIGKANDEDLKSIFAYLQSLAPVRNRVPAPIDPGQDAGTR